MTPGRVIIAVEGGAPTGGAERIAFDTVRILSQQGVPTTILSSAKAVDSAFANLPGVDTICLNLPLHFERFFAAGKAGMVLNLLEDRTMRPMFEQILRTLDSPQTILHAHGFHNFFTQACLHVATDLKLKTVVTCHDFGLTCPNATLFNYQTSTICELKPLSGECRKSACMGADAMRLKQLRFARSWASTKLHRVPQRLNKILAVSDFEREILQRQVPAGVKVESLFNPVDPASMVRQNPSQSQTYLWIGRMTQEKDGVTPATVCRDMDLPLTFVGEGPLQGEIQQANPDATFLGWLSPSAVKEQQCKARALLMTSKWHETASLVVLESLAAGIPCVVPTTSAATNWIEDGVNGLTFEAGNASSLASALAKLKDDATVETMSKRAFEMYWQAPFTVERYQNDLMRHYEGALNQ